MIYRIIENYNEEEFEDDNDLSTEEIIKNLQRVIEINHEADKLISHY